jgi:hypothetical protein
MHRDPLAAYKIDKINIRIPDQMCRVNRPDRIQGLLGAHHSPAPFASYGQEGFPQRATRSECRVP